MSYADINVFERHEIADTSSEPIEARYPVLQSSTTGWRATQFVAEVTTEIKVMEQVEVERDFDAVAYAGEDSAPRWFEHQSRRTALLELLESFRQHAPTWDATETFVTDGSLMTARIFIQALPENRQLPQVAPDGEGDILLRWPPERGDLIVTIEHGLFHVVVNVSTDRSQHIDAVPLLTDRIPPAILAYIPVR